MRTERGPSHHREGLREELEGAEERVWKRNLKGRKGRGPSRHMGTGDGRKTASTNKNPVKHVRKGD